jgi:hypothetical protein
MDSDLKENNWTPVKQGLKRFHGAGKINRIVRIMRPSAERPLAAGEKIPDKAR